jgi:hypothetical protein
MSAEEAPSSACTNAATLGERIHRTITIHEMRKLMEGKQNSFADFSQQVFEKEQGRSSGDFLSSLSGSSC